MERHKACLALIAFILTLVGCRGKRGPEGPPGRDLTRPQDGFIEGTARGKDNAGNAFHIPFRYTYHFGNPGTAVRVNANTLRIEFGRWDELGIGYMNISFTYNRTTREASDIQISGIAADISQKPIPAHSFGTVSAVPPTPSPGTIYPGTTQRLTNIQLEGDTVLTADFEFIRPQFTSPPIPIPGLDLSAFENTHPDTVRGRLSVRLLPVVSYGRQGQSQ